VQVLHAMVLRQHHRKPTKSSADGLMIEHLNAQQKLTVTYSNSGV
jgi:hypothetical protein